MPGTSVDIKPIAEAGVVGAGGRHSALTVGRLVDWISNLGWPSRSQSLIGRFNPVAPFLRFAGAGLNEKAMWIAGGPRVAATVPLPLC